jgi:hypothetical protein
MEKVKQELNRVITDNKKVLEKVHHGLMYETKPQSDEDLDKLVCNTKLRIQKAQQCLDLINN